MKVLLVTHMRCAECGMDLYLHSYGRSSDGNLQWRVEHPKHDYCSQEGVKNIDESLLGLREL